MTSSARQPSDEEIHDSRCAEYAVAESVVAFSALAGVNPDDEEVNPLWALAQENGWDLDSFVRAVFDLGEGLASRAVDVLVHDQIDHDCPCPVTRRLRPSVYREA